MSNFLWPHVLEPTRFLSPWDFPGYNTGVGSLLQDFFLTQDLNTDLSHFRQNLYCLSHCCCCCCRVASVVSDSVRPHRWQPTRLPRPWDSPGKNTGVGCHFLLQCMKVTTESEVTQSCLTLSNIVDCSPPGSSVHGIFQARLLEWVAIAFSVTHSRVPQFSMWETLLLSDETCWRGHSRFFS